MSKAGRQGALIAIMIALLLGPAGSAWSESSLRLPSPEVFGTIPASTYDENLRRVGDAKLVFETLDDSHARLLVASGIDGGARTVAKAEFEVVDGGEYLRLLSEESRSFDSDGTPLGVLSIDHVRGVASCDKIDGDEITSESIQLPEDDRVANVPLNLLFLPLVEGTTDEVNFQVLLCRFGARLVNIDAHIASRGTDAAGNSIVEVEYRPNFGGFLSAVAGRWLPRLSVWFDSSAASAWIAHRIPLYSKGPEVFVIREGIPSSLLVRPN
jgi:hypothetical protein